LQVFVCLQKYSRDRENDGNSLTQNRGLDTARFRTLCYPPQLVNNARDLDTDQIIHELNLAVEHFNARESGFVLDTLGNFTVIITQYSPQTGSTFVPTPRRISGKRAVVNVLNSDNRCFQWAILSCLYPPKSHPKMYTVTQNTRTL